MTIPLTVGMAVFRDFDGVYFTLQSLRLHNSPKALAQTEFIVVDNDPGSEHGKETRKLCEKGVARGTAGVRYIPMPEAGGTTQPRQRIFDEAKGDAVLCLDSHVMLRAGALARLIEHYAYDENPNLYSGPMLHDDLLTAPTHFIPRWRSQMWGIWGTAWRHRDDPTKRLAYIDELPEGGESAFFLDSSLAARVPHDVPNAGHPAFRHLLSLGYRTIEPADPPFEIPGMGLGLFTCRRKAWPGFCPHFRQFGGEELYIHEKVRQRGGKNICLPWLQWSHRFGRVGGPKYPLSKYAKVRNYVLGFSEIGRPAAEIYHHFVDRNFDGDPIRHLAYEHGEDPRKIAGKTLAELAAIHARHKLPLAQWEHLMEDPISHENPPVAGSAVSVPRDIPTPNTLPAGLLEAIAGKKRDLDQHAKALTSLASQCGVVWEFTRRVQSTAALLLSSAPVVHTAMSGLDLTSDEWAALKRFQRPGWTFDQIPDGAKQVAFPGECDMLFYKPLHEQDSGVIADALSALAPSVRRWIVLHDTRMERWTDGKPGPVFAIREFIKERPEWFVASHEPNQFGLTILSRDTADKPPEPITPWPKGGPGTELAGLLHKLGVNPHPACGCRKRMQQMDAWGVDECRTRRDEIVAWMREGAPKYGWVEKLKAAANAVLTGIAFTVNWADPYPDLVDAAINLAEKAPQE